MSKPKSVTILGRTYHISYPKKIDGQDSYGECNGPDRHIKVKENLKGEMMEETLLHEIIHGILYTSGVSEFLDEKTEEAIVLALENGLFPIYSRNFE